MNKDVGPIILLLHAMQEEIGGEIIAHGILLQVIAKKIIVGAVLFMQMKLLAMLLKELNANGNIIIARKKTVIVLILQM